MKIEKTKVIQGICESGKRNKRPVDVTVRVASDRNEKYLSFNVANVLIQIPTREVEEFLSIKE